MAVAHTFACAACGADAGRVSLYAAGEPAVPETDDERGRTAADSLNHRLDTPRLAVTCDLGDLIIFEFPVDAVVRAIGDADAPTLHRIDVEIVPFWCPTCPASYCAAHWRTWITFDGEFFDEKRGACPNGHERLILD